MDDLPSGKTDVGVGESRHSDPGKAADNCGTSEIAVQDGSVTISNPPTTQDDTLDAWFDRAQAARERMAVDEEYRKEVAKRIS